jgi:cysteine protease ATG4
MLNRLLKTKMFENNNNNDDDDDNNIDDYCNLRYRAQSTSHLLSPDSATIKSVSSTSSTSSLTPGNSPKTNLSSFLKISSPKTHSPPSSENGFLMTIVRNPSTNSQRIQSNEPVGTPVTNEELSNNNKFFKSKMTAALNHMKYRWVVKMRPNFRTNESPIYFLGKAYNGKEETSCDDIPRPPSEQSYANFLKTFSQRIYFSYRKQFEPLTSSRTGDIITSDGGWGCMIRCAQMLLAQTLLIHMTNAYNSYYSNIQISDRCPKRNSIDCVRNSNRINRRTQIYTDIIRLFGDYPHSRCPFGIHKIVELGTSHGIRPGEFFGPVSAAHCLKEAVQVAVEANEIPEILRIYISQDAIIYRQDVNDLCSTPLFNNRNSSIYPSLDSLINENISNRWYTSVLILVPLRLGLNELDLIYEDYLKEALKLPQTVGIIGGSPRHAVYILGFQDDSFIDLDPHFIQTTVNVLDETFDISSYSCSAPKKLTARKMDPSCTLGFYCRDKADFEMFCAQWNHVWHMASEDRRSCPIFRIERGTFQESHNRTLNYEYPPLNEDEDVCLRVTKLLSTTNSSIPLNKPLPNQSKSTLVNSTIIHPIYRDSWDDTGRSLNDNANGQSHSLSDDYVFL